MPDTILGHGATQCGGDVILHEEIGKFSGAVTAGEGDGHLTESRAGGKAKCPRLPTATPNIA